MKIKNLFREFALGGMVYKMSIGTLPGILPPMGGLIYWQDIEEHNGWKLQRNESTNHYRILNPDDVKVALGTEEEMERLLKNLSEQLVK